MHGLVQNLLRRQKHGHGKNVTHLSSQNQQMALKTPDISPSPILLWPVMVKQ